MKEFFQSFAKKIVISSSKWIFLIKSCYWLMTILMTMAMTIKIIVIDIRVKKRGPNYWKVWKWFWVCGMDFLSLNKIKWCNMKLPRFEIDDYIRMAFFRVWLCVWLLFQNMENLLKLTKMWNLIDPVKSVSYCYLRNVGNPEVVALNQ